VVLFNYLNDFTRKGTNHTIFFVDKLNLFQFGLIKGELI